MSDAVRQLPLALDDANSGVGVQRYECWSLSQDRADVPRGKTERTREGYLQITGLPIARIGTQEYLNADGSTRRELRLPEHVFAADALGSGERRPLTVRHPVEHGGEVNAANYRVLSAGSMSNLRGDESGRYVLADLTIQAKDAVDAVDRGVRELSVGYRFRPVPLPDGVFRSDGHALDGAQADLLQTAIHINHLALVEAGRANVGDPAKAVRIRLDAAGNQLAPDAEETHMTMKKIRIGGKLFDVPEHLASAFDATLVIGSDQFEVPAAVKAYVDSMNADMAKLKDGRGVEGAEGPGQATATLAQLRAELAAARARESNADARADRAEGALAAAQKEAETLKAAADQAATKETAEARADHYDLVQQTAKATGQDARELVAKTTAELRRTLAEKITGQALDGKSEDFVAGVLAHATAAAPKRGSAVEDASKARGLGVQSTQDAAESPLAKAMQANINRFYGQPAKA